MGVENRNPSSSIVFSRHSPVRPLSFAYSIPASCRFGFDDGYDSTCNGWKIFPRYDAARVWPQVPNTNLLADLAGKWNQEIKYWMAPGTQPIIIKGSCENRLILGGRFLVSDSKSGNGATLESQTIFGFDRRHKEYQFIGLDTTGTYYVMAAGLTDPITRSIIAYGEDRIQCLGTHKSTTWLPGSSVPTNTSSK